MRAHGVDAYNPDSFYLRFRDISSIAHMTAEPSSRPSCRGTAALFAVAALWASPSLGQALFERVQGRAPSELIEGDTLLGWTVDARRGGTFSVWSDVETWSYALVNDGPIRLRVRPRDGSPEREVVLASGARQIFARPSMAAGLRSALNTAVAAEATDLPTDFDDASLDVRLWAMTRLGDAHAQAGRWPEAETSYQQARSWADGLFEAELGRRLGDVLFRTGRTVDAEASYRAALATWQTEGGGELGLSILTTSMGRLTASTYQLARAAEWHQRSCDLRRSVSPVGRLVANCINNLGTVAARRNDLARAEELFQEALALAAEDSPEQASPLSNLIAVARLRGELERAAEYGRRAIVSVQRHGRPGQLANTLANVANVHADRERYDEAEAIYTELFEVFERRPTNALFRLQTLTNRSQMRVKAGRLEDAEKDLESALQIAEEASLEDAHLLHQTGELRRRQGRRTEARDALRKAAELRDETRPDSIYGALAWSALGAVHDELGDAAAAEQAHRAAVDRLEQQQQRLGGGDRGLVAFREKHAHVYDRLINLLERLGRPEEAFEVYERSRGAALLALLHQRDLDLPLSAQDETLRRQRAALDRTIEQRYRKLATAPTDDDLRAEIETLRTERDALTARLHRGSPRLAAIENPPRLGAGEIRQQLGPGTVLLAYHLRGGDALVFIVTREAIRLEHLETAPERLASLVDTWVDTLNSTVVGHRRFLRANAELGRLLLGPAAQTIARASRLQVVPDGPLHRISFAALPDPGDPSRHLVEALPLARQVSASVLTTLRDRPQESRRSVTALGDTLPLLQGSGPGPSRFGRLPASRDEAMAVASAYETGVVALGSAAHEGAAREALETSKTTHFACHAVVDEKLPMDSALLLSPSDDGGQLSAWEIAEQLSSASPLVVLSACETAGGRQRAGEGIVGLVRALQIAGARNIVAGLGEVEDASSAALMARFHQNLAGGQDPASALRAAQIELIRGPVEWTRDGAPVELDATRPRHWARFVLIGDVGVDPEKGG